MRKFGISILAVLLLALAAGWVFCCSSRTVPLEECSELYRHYAGSKGIEATFVQGYRLNDSVRVDVTFLQATDSVGWNQLQIDFKLPVIPPQYGKLAARSKSVIFNYIPKDSLYLADRKDKTDCMDRDLIVALRQEHQVCIFHLETENQLTAILRKHADNIKLQNKTL